MSEVDMRARLLPLLALGILALASFAHAQNQNKSTVVIVPDGGARGPMESIFIPPKPGAPFSLMLAAEWLRPLNNGGSYTLANERRVVRDSRGRIYQERWILVPKGGAIKSTMNVFQITDPEQHTWYNCETTAKVCELLTYHLTTENTYLPPIGKTGPLPDGRGSQQHEDLGPGNTEGVETHGYRETQTLNPGVMGNDAPMVTVREFWYSQELGINLVRWSTARSAASRCSQSRN
jgi:hypothetical protein